LILLALWPKLVNRCGVPEHKRQYRGEEIPVYIATKRVLVVTELLRLIRCIGLI